METKEFTIHNTDFEAAYMDLYRIGQLKRRVEEAVASLASCQVCPRDCKINRLEDKQATCQTGRYALVSSAFPHFGEENCLRGTNGSGTIFFAGCNLRCVFCQNYDISHHPHGEAMTASQLAATMIELQNRRCHNINFVTPEHVVPQVLEALLIAAEAGLRLPIVYNTSAYDSLHSLKLLDGVVDIYMPDFKYWTAESGSRYLKAKDYGEVARATIKEMHRQVGDLVVDENGIAKRGLLVRHLVMPEGLEETRSIMSYLAKDISKDTYVNVMGQYYPAAKVSDKKYPEINRRIMPSELRSAAQIAQDAGLWRLDGRSLLRA